jgi:transposase-like protein
MSSKRYTEEFRAEADRWVTERGYPVSEYAKRLRVTTYSLYKWRKAGTISVKNAEDSSDHPASGAAQPPPSRLVTKVPGAPLHE